MEAKRVHAKDAKGQDRQGDWRKRTGTGRSLADGLNRVGCISCSYREVREGREDWTFGWAGRLLREDVSLFGLLDELYSKCKTHISDPAAAVRIYDEVS